MSAGRPTTLVLLHGHDDDPAAFTPVAEALAGALGPTTAVVVPLGPVTTSPDRRAWWDAAQALAGDEGASSDPVAAAIADAVAILDAALADLAGPDRLVVAGFSQGAALLLTWLVDATRTVRPDAAVAIAGWLEALPTTGTTDDGLADLPLLVTYGEDDEVVPPPASRSAGKVLARRGAEVATVEVATGHTPVDAFLPVVTTWLTTLT